MPARETAPSGDLSKMTKVQKLAALLVLLGPDSAAQIMKHLDDHEIQALSAEISKMTLLDGDLQRAILREFSPVAVEASTGILGGIEFAQRTLEKSVGLFKANEIINRVSPNRTHAGTVAQIVEMDPRQIFNLIRREHVQTIALILSYLPSERSAQVLAYLPEAQRDPIVERLAGMAPTPIEVMEKIVQVLNEKMGSKHTRALNQTGGTKNAAEILNALDKNSSKNVLLNLEDRNPELGQAIRQKMFTFEDMAALDSSALQRILREVEMRDLATALKTASETLKASLLGSISRRAAETVKEEISFLGSIKLRDIEAAQNRIIESVRQLESEGEIEISGNSEDAMVDALRA